MRRDRLHRILPAFTAVILPALLLSACNTLQEQQAAPAVASAATVPAEATDAPPAIAAAQTSAADESPSADAAPAVVAPTVVGTGKPLHTVSISDSESPRNDGIHDPNNAAIDILQSPREAMSSFPRDRRQQVDWVKAMDQGLIKPRIDLQGETQQMMVLDLDILMKNTQSMPWVKFPHKQHTKWLGCDNCHPAIFEMKQGANPITMNKVLRGEYCGVCHDKVAFALFTCERCHSVPHEGSGEKWW